VASGHRYAGAMVVVVDARVCDIYPYLHLIFSSSEAVQMVNVSISLFMSLVEWTDGGSSTITIKNKNANAIMFGAGF
jgi:hypothetical protein